MQQSTYWAAAIVAGGLLLGGCGGNDSHVSTSTPSSTLGTDSAASKVGGMPDTSKMATPGVTTPPIGSQPK